MAISQRSLSSDELWPVNHLTRISRQPGNLDYDAYRQYLAAIGHIKPVYNFSGFVGPAEPQNTFLQSKEGDRDDDRTDFRADQAHWTQDNLPDIIYIFDKPDLGWLAKHQLREPPLKTYEIYGVRLRDLPILPDHISSQIEGWRVEAWMRMDPRLKLMDIIDRFEPDKRPNNKSGVQMRVKRFRENCNVLGWVSAGSLQQERKDELKWVMYKNGIDYRQNSTRGISWGLKNPRLGEEGGRIVVPEDKRVEDTVAMTRLPLTPIPGSCTTITTPTPMYSTLSMISTPLPQKPALIPGPDPRLDQYRPTDDIKVPDKQPSLGANSSTSTTNQHQLPLPALIEAGIFLTNLPYPRTSRLHPYPPPLRQLQPQQPFRPAHQPHRQFPRPPSRHPTPPSPTPPPTNMTTLTYYGKPLTLKTPKQRAHDAAQVANLSREWHPAGSDGRRLQLAYLLDPAKVRNGFVDNRGHWPPACGVWDCIDADIVYR